jgi:Outer membrane protein beta-barrel domain
VRQKLGCLRISVRRAVLDNWRIDEMRTGSLIRPAGAVSALALLLVILPGAAGAQDRPGPAAEFSAGWIGFADDGVVSEGMVGGTARWYLSPRVAIGPESVFIQGSNHSHFALTANVTFDLLSPVNGRPRPVTPFIVAGAGMFQTRETFFNGPYTSTEGAFTAGGGVRARAGDHVTLGVDTRIGWELHVRVNGFVGVQF